MTKLVFATWAVVEYQGAALNKFNARNRLISYFELRDKPASLLADYVRDGKCPPPKKKKGKK